MPTLEWIGKDKVVNHHQEVPYRVLERQYSYDEAGQHAEDNGSENIIIHGDNLEALKALLPRYEGKVKCIYIDPPYNTGEEGWVYNDNVNDPKIKNWLGQVVGKEGEDLSRHDKWLCMMYPRLKLLYKLLANDGLIAVSINDHELYDLGAIMNEIFGTSHRLACAPLRSEPSGGKEKTVGKLDLKDSFGKYRKGRELRKWGAGSLREDRPNMWFPIIAPNGEAVYPIKNDGKEGRWRLGKDNDYMAKILENPEWAHWEICQYDDGVLVDGKHERLVPFEKIRDAKKSFGWNSWLDGYGTNADGTAVIKAIFGSKLFDTPKPLSLLEWIISLHNDENAIILDSFAGSGTTAHAVLNMNKADGGNRKFILVEMMDYADSITAERVKRVIDGYGEGKKAVEGTGGNFNYYELGPVLLLPDGNLNEEVGPQKIREYVYYMETKEPLPTEQPTDEPYFMGLCRNTAYYFYYERESVTTLDHAFLATIQTKAEGYTIYADLCAIPQETLRKHNITFKKIPRDIARL